MTTTVFFSLAIGFGAPTLKDKDAGSELYGVWEIEETAEEKRLRGIERRGPPYRWRFNRDGTWQVFRGDKEIAEPRGFKFNPKADPPTLDLNTPPTTKLSPLVLAIYKIEEDCLTICCAYSELPRPKAFDRNGPRSLQKFHRVKD